MFLRALLAVLSCPGVVAYVIPLYVQTRTASSGNGIPRACRDGCSGFGPRASR